MTPLDELQEVLGYRFHNVELLEEALNHPSLRYANQKKNTQVRDYERLEFLGDSVLGMLVAHMLFDAYPNEREGDLARRLAALVCRSGNVEVARKINLGQYLRMTDGEASGGGRNNENNLEDSCEALIGAIYLDGGIEAARSVIQKFWKPLSEKVSAPPKDAKSALQEWAQGKGLPLPEYLVVSSEGPDHAPVFQVKVMVEGLSPVLAEGSSKKSAEQKAAIRMLEEIERNG